ncbi:hypothetical protein GGH94_002099 [Coemansia aciculifera]|uniref:Uncharacterized protein n=1 Tax=Coemansia aciculifera TaxID=417176 RepID=A0A9W8IK46_9FUNG|nr:hypothetical protein GGH94_002099 [Coemansia aciculifera]
MTVFVKQERLLRISKSSLLQVHIYLQESNIEWFTDAILQEMLQEIQPALPGKVAECLKGIKKASQLKNRALQVAYFIDKADPLGQVLLQEPRVKDEDEVEDQDIDGESPATNKGLFTYKALRPARNVLVLVPEPFDANNDRCQTTQSGGPPEFEAQRSASNSRFLRAVDLLNESARSGSLETAWAAYLELCDLEGTLEQTDMMSELHRLLPVTTIRSILRGIHPKFSHKKGSADEAAHSLYMYTKLLNHLLLVSRLKKAERNDVVALQLAMGQCMRRLIDSRLVRSPEEAQSFVQRLEQISADSSQPLRLTLFDMRLLVLGAWKSQRHLLVPYLYQLACKQRRSSDESGFQRLSAVVLSFYVREYTGPDECIAPSVITGILEDLNQRAIRLTSHHYSMLILYFGKTGNMGEALRILERAMDDPASRKTEAIYYNTFRAFASSLAPQAERRSHTQQLHEDLEPPPALDPGSSNDGLDYIDELDSVTEDCAIGSNAPNSYGAGQGDVPMQLEHTSLRPEHVQAARICSTIFQTMVSHNIAIGFRTYRELINCMVQFGMNDKARKIFEFAVDSLSDFEIKAHLVAFYLRQTTRSPHQMLQALHGIIQTTPSVEATMRGLSKRTLVDQFGIFDGDLQAFIERQVRPVVEGRGGEFLSRYLCRMHKAKHAADFIRCMAAGNDPRGQFSGFNFLPLGSDGSGLAAVEGEIATTCRVIGSVNPKWLKHADVIYGLLPILPGIASVEGEPEGVAFIRRLAGSECANVEQLMALLDSAQIESYSIGLVNQFLRVKYLGLTFQQYVSEKVAAASLNDGGTCQRDGAMFWPSFMYAKSNGAMLRADASQAGMGRDGPAARSILAAAVECWEQLTSAFKRNPGGRLSPDENTVGILSLVCIRAGSWGFGQRLWSDVFRLMGSSGRFVSDAFLPTRQPLQCVRMYKHYIYYLTMVSLAANRDRGKMSAIEAQNEPHVFGDEALTDMFLAMERGGVEATSGLLCQAIRAGFEVGLIDVSSALEQWQLQRERCGVAPPGFLRQYFAARGLPEIPAQLSSMLDLVKEPAYCPRLSSFVAQQMRALS